MSRMIERYYGERVKEVSESFGKLEEVEVRIGKIKKGSLKAMILFYSEGVDLEPKIEVNFDAKQSQAKVARFEEMFRRLQEGNRIDEQPVVGKVISDSRKQDRLKEDIEYDQRIYREIKEEMQKERKSIFDRPSANQQIGVPKSQEVLRSHANCGRG